MVSMRRGLIDSSMGFGMSRVFSRGRLELCRDLIYTL